MKLRDIIVILVVAVLAVFLIKGIHIESTEDYYKTHIDEIRDGDKSISLEIRCDTILNNWDMLDQGIKDEGLIPEDGVILKKTNYRLEEGETVFDVLKKATQYQKIHMEYIFNEVFNAYYIEGIQNLYQFSCGPDSGWVFMVNGMPADRGCSEYVLNDKDEILWAYTCDLGRDVYGDNWIW